MSLEDAIKLVQSLAVSLEAAAKVLDLARENGGEPELVELSFALNEASGTLDEAVENIKL